MWRNDDNQQNKDVIAHSIGWIASIGSGVLTFLVTPLAYTAILPFLGRFTATHYGYEFVSAVEFTAFPVVVALTYFIIRALIALLLRMGQLLAATIR